jgi:hypothetical protein
MVGREAGGLRILRNGSNSSTKTLKRLMVIARIKPAIYQRIICVVDSGHLANP